MHLKLFRLFYSIVILYYNLTVLSFLFLGAKAKSTHRSTKLSEYIREGQTKAVTKIHLYNGGEGTAHDKDVYGDRIVIQREIFKGSTKLDIRDCFGRVIKSGDNARPELDHILSKFHIDVENSVIIMHQEEAKSFFQHAEPNKLFNFYMKGTLLQKELEKMNIEFKQFKDQVRNLDNEYKTTREKQEKLTKDLAKLQEEHDTAEQDVLNHHSTIKTLKN